MFLYRNTKTTRLLTTFTDALSGESKINWKYSLLSRGERLYAKLKDKELTLRGKLFLITLKADILLDKVWFELDYYVTQAYTQTRLFFRELFIWNPQRRKKGFDDRDLWNLDMTIIKFVRDFLQPRLTDFKRINVNSYPCLVESSEAWHLILSQILEGFDLIVKYGCIDDSHNDDEQLAKDETRKMQLAIELFSKYWTNLWD